MDTAALELGPWESYWATEASEGSSSRDIIVLGGDSVRAAQDLCLVASSKSPRLNEKLGLWNFLLPHLNRLKSRGARGRAEEEGLKSLFSGSSGPGPASPAPSPVPSLRLSRLPCACNSRSASLSCTAEASEHSDRLYAGLEGATHCQASKLFPCSASLTLWPLAPSCRSCGHRSCSRAQAGYSVYSKPCSMRAASQPCLCAFAPDTLHSGLRRE